MSCLVGPVAQGLGPICVAPPCFVLELPLRQARTVSCSVGPVADSLGPICFAHPPFVLELLLRTTRTVSCLVDLVAHSLDLICFAHPCFVLELLLPKARTVLGCLASAPEYIGSPSHTVLHTSVAHRWWCWVRGRGMTFEVFLLSWPSVVESCTDPCVGVFLH